MLKWFWIFLGSTSVAAGLLVVWSPVPLGLPLFMIGVPLLMKYSPHSRNSIQRLATQFPRLFMPLRGLLPIENSNDDSTGSSGNTPDRQ